MDSQNKDITEIDQEQIEEYEIAWALLLSLVSHLMISKENYDYRGYRDAEPYDSEVSYQKWQPTNRVEVLLPTFITRKHECSLNDPYDLSHDFRKNEKIGGKS